MGCLAMDMTARCGFAANINSFDEEQESGFVSHGQKILKTFMAFMIVQCKNLLHTSVTTFSLVSGLLVVSVTFPLTFRIIRFFGLDLLHNASVDFFRTILEKLYDERMTDTEAKEVCSYIRSVSLLRAGLALSEDHLSGWRWGPLGGDGDTYCG